MAVDVQGPMRRSQKASKFAHASIDLLCSERLTARDIAGNLRMYVASLGGFMRHISGRGDAARPPARLGCM